MKTSSTLTANMFEHILIVGANSCIASAIIETLRQKSLVKKLTLLARQNNNNWSFDETISFIACNPNDELQLIEVAQKLTTPLDGILICTGVLHTEHWNPEKTFLALSKKQLIESFTINSIIPALVAKYFCPLLIKSKLSFFAALSAKIGSITDNHLGGWYSYRASKAALNMLIKTLSLELRYTLPLCTVVALHPGTVRSPFSQPFISERLRHQILTPQESASHLIALLQGLTPEQSGAFLSWDGTNIPY